MADIYFTIKKEEKEKAIELIDSLLGADKRGRIYEKNHFILSYRCDNLQKAIQTIKDTAKLLQRAEAVFQIRDKDKIYCHEIIYCNPKKEENIAKLNINELKPDHKEKIGDKFLFIFEFKLRAKPDSPHPDSYESVHVPVRLRYLGTDNEEDWGLTLYSKNEDKMKCDRIVIGKIFRGLNSGASVNDETDTQKAIKKANEELKKRGKEIIDIENTYKKILANLKSKKEKDHTYFCGTVEIKRRAYSYDK